MVDFTRSSSNKYSCGEPSPGAGVTSIVAFCKLPQLSAVDFARERSLSPSPSHHVRATCPGDRVRLSGPNTNTSPRPASKREPSTTPQVLSSRWWAVLCVSQEQHLLRRSDRPQPLPRTVPQRACLACLSYPSNPSAVAKGTRNFYNRSGWQLLCAQDVGSVPGFRQLTCLCPPIGYVGT